MNLLLAQLARGPAMIAVLLFSAATAECASLIDDRQITIQSASDVKEKRRQLIQYIWGAAGWPKERLPTSVKTLSQSPVKALDELQRVDELRFDLAPGLEGLAYHFIPKKPVRELVVLHHGHACTLDDDPSPENVGYGLQRTTAVLLADGYSVLGVFMPHMRPGDCTGGHDAMFSTQSGSSPMRYFLEPVAISLNYLKSHHRKARFPKYKKFHMAGLSGGGWTTTVYAAIDPTIQRSFSVAGTMPLYLRFGGSVGDREQFEPSFYSIAGYQDLYILGAHGRGRSQTQIHVRRDDCCFGEAQHDERAAGLPYVDALRHYEQKVQSTLKAIRDGKFQLEIDEIAPSHMISHHAIRNIILPELKRTAP